MRSLIDIPIIVNQSIVYLIVIMQNDIFYGLMSMLYRLIAQSILLENYVTI